MTERRDNTNKMSKRTLPSKASGILRYSGMAMQMLGTIFIFTYGGYRLDEWLENRIPIWTLVLSLTSIAASLYLLIKGLSRNRDH